MTGTDASLRPILFDCDGVLIDSETIACRIEVEVLTALGHPISYDAFCRRFIGTSRAHSLAELERDWGRPLPADYAAQVQARLFQAFRDELRPVAGMTALVAALDRPIAVASSSSPERLAYTLALAGYDRRFGGAVFSAHEVKHGKPAPDLFLHAAARLGVAPGSCTVVEDSIFGIRAAQAAGMRALGFVGGGHCGPDHAGRLEAAGAEAVAKDAAGLARLLAAD